MGIKKPKNIILIVADSLRYDSVYKEGAGVPYMEKNAVQFTNASSPACWTLPSTSSIFTGLLPHEHKATTQSRKLSKDTTTLAEIMKMQGYNTYQVTANVATTDIFGLERGFDHVYRTWDLQAPNNNTFWTLAMMMGKPRIRNKVLSKRVISDDLSQDLRAGSVWVQNYRSVVFDKANQLLTENEAKGEGTFLFLNLMETHFPYHIDDKFKTESDTIAGKLKELKSLYQIVNQDFLKKENAMLDDDMLAVMKRRQEKSWKLIRKQLDEFVRSLHENKDNLVVFISDHGENFGDQDWLYHFSNVTDACTRVPMFWLDHNGRSPQQVDHPLSSRLLFHSLAKAAGYDKLDEREDLFTEVQFNIPFSQSFWYNSQGKTLDKFKFNQLVFKIKDDRYLKKNKEWYHAKEADYKSNDSEPLFEKITDYNPVEDAIEDQELQSYIQEKVKGFDAFEASLKNVDSE